MGTGAVATAVAAAAAIVKHCSDRVCVVARKTRRPASPGSWSDASSVGMLLPNGPYNVRSCEIGATLQDIALVVLNRASRPFIFFHQESGVSLGMVCWKGARQLVHSCWHMCGLCYM